jgi:predicted amidohydrolase
MRVAVAQFATTINCQENLATCLRMINETAACKPAIIVLPEFCNTQPCYADHNEAWHQALATDSEFLQQVALQAKQHGCYIVLNLTLRRDMTRDHQNASIKSNISITSCLFSPLGELVQQVDKKNLSEQDNIYFTCSHEASTTVSTVFGEFGMLIGDGHTSQPSRDLALNGAQLLCNSEHSFALDQSKIHDFARATENNVFTATANKVGALLAITDSEDVRDSAKIIDSFLAFSSIDKNYHVGAGQSQIVAPGGTTLAKIANNKEGYTFADINLAEAGLKKKLRPDGTRFNQQQRPELYIEKTLVKQPTTRDDEYGDKVPESANVAIFATYKANEQAIEDVCHYIENNLSDIIQLPELFFIGDKTVTHNSETLKHIERMSTELIQQVSAVLRPFQYVCTSLVLNGNHHAVLISQHGIFATQQQLHFCQRYQWTALADRIKIIELPLEQGNINLVMLTADDANIAETVNVLALNDIHLLLVPFDIQEPQEVEYNLVAKAAENSICIVAASREKSFAIQQSSNEKSLSANQNNKKIKTQKSTGLIANLTSNSALLAQWQSGKFNGYINRAIVKHQHGKITKALIHPMSATEKNIIN